MTKKQKIWLGIFGAMFLIPEILWGLCGNFLYNVIRFMFSMKESEVFYSFFKFPDSSHSTILLKSFLLVQMAGLSGIFGFVRKIKIKKIFKCLLLLLIIIIIISNIFFLIFTLNFNPKIG